MLQSVISGFFFLFIALCLGPALVIAGFQLLGGQKIRLPSLIKPLVRVIFALAALLVETAGVVANMVAEQCPAKYARMQPIVKPLVIFAILAAIGGMMVTFLFVLTDR